MRSIVPSFPGGMPGAGLLLLRLSVAASLIAGLGPVVEAPGWKQCLALLIAVGLCVGFRTRLLTGLCIAAAASELALGGDVTILGILLVDAAALALTGPGAFAADARLFGRRTVIVPRGDTIV
jgi:hypothetical protein